MRRGDAVEAIMPFIQADDLVIVSIGRLKDDWWNFKRFDNSFYSTALGSVTSIALGLATALPHRRVISVDSDGSLLLNLGILCTLGAVQPHNLTVVAMDNGRYDSTGGHTTHTGRNTDLAKVAEGAGCPNCATALDTEALAREFERLLTDESFGFLNVKLSAARHEWTTDQQKPTDGTEDKYQFLRYVERLEGKIIHSGVAHH